MKRVLKNAFRRLLAKFGFQIIRIDDSKIHIAAFSNLAKFFEQQMGSAINMKLPPNEERYRLLGKLQGTPPTEAYFILDAIEKCRNIEGDICEFGVAEGETSALIACEIEEDSKKFHLFDSFEGLPKPSDKDTLIDDIFSLGSMDAYQGKMSFPEASVLGRLESVGFPKDRIVVHKGFVPEVFNGNTSLPTRVSVAYVDFDFYEPIKEALEFLDSVTSPGAKIIVDDYGFFSAGAKLAVDEWLTEVNAHSNRYELFEPGEAIGKFVVITKSDVI